MTLSSVPFYLLQQLWKHTGPETGDVWAAVQVLNPWEGLGGWQCLDSEKQVDTLLQPNISPWLLMCMFRDWGGVHPSRSITALGQKSCRGTLPSPALTRKEFLGSCVGQAHQVSRSQCCQHCLVSCPRASSATRVFWGGCVFEVHRGSMSGSCQSPGAGVKVHMEAKAWTQMTLCLGSY